jgi:hypothetical protein
VGILKYGESKILLRFGKSSVSQNKDKKRNKFGFVILFLVASAVSYICGSYKHSILTPRPIEFVKLKLKLNYAVLNKKMNQRQ